MAMLWALCVAVAPSPGAAAAAPAILPRPEPRPSLPPYPVPKPPVAERGDTGSADSGGAAKTKVTAKETAGNGGNAPDDPGPPFDPKAAASCETELRGLSVRFERLDPLSDPPCGAPRPLSVSRVGKVTLAPPVTVRCEAARSLALWIERVVVPAAVLHLDAGVTTLATAASYHCRHRVGATEDKWSEHAFANAIDVSAVLLDDETRVPIQPRPGSPAPARAFQAAIRGGACAYFTTVLGPTTNAAHDDHLHLDMAQRRGGYRLCE